MARNNKRLKMLAWNTGGWGALYSQFDIVAKTQSLLRLFDDQRAGMAVLTDIKFSYQGIRE